MAYYVPPSDKLPESRHSAVGGWFFGPRAENFDFLRKAFNYILDTQQKARESTYPDDAEFITPEMKGTELYQRQIELIRTELVSISEQLASHSIPFWSPRYNAHMSMESSMPSVIGYLAGLLHNQNNVATEASAFTTVLEKKVGDSLCRMLGFNTIVSGKVVGPSGQTLNSKTEPAGWGHITCGGSVANLESIWAARNLKFYPLSLRLAIEKGPLSFLSGAFKIDLCSGESKLFTKCTTWELLNLKPSTVLNIPTQLYEEFGVSQTALTNAFTDFSIQTVGKDFLEKHFNVETTPCMFVGTTKHYSWPKGAAIAGLGKAQIIDVPVDNQARMDPAKLRGMLEKALKDQRAIYSVVAIIGSTEQGAVDPLTDVLALRTEFEKRGLSFVVHCDAAWGGYFASCVRSPITDIELDMKGEPEYVPILALSPYTRQQLLALGEADSVTIDPHKSGYCPYPAGGLCYKDGRMRYLITWTSPIVFRGADVTESIGVYGVEGSKPGAAAVGAWLSHRVLGLNKNGYGTVLGEAILTCSRLYCHWAAMKTEPITIDGVKARLTITPFTMLPAEREGKDVDAQKQFIRDHIIGKDNKTVFEDKAAVELLAQMGGDLMINAFACNFELDGVVNKDVIEANYFNTRIFNRTALTQEHQEAKDFPLYLTSTQFAQSAYQGCLDTYKRRMGVEGPQDLYSLINVTMGPWSTSHDFVQTIANNLKKIAEEELAYVVHRNVQKPTIHGFILQGLEGDKVCGVHLPMFNMQNHRWQLIISCKLPETEHNMLRDMKKQDPSAWFTFANLTAEQLPALVKDGASFNARLDRGIPPDGTKPLAEVEVTDIKVLYKRSMRHEFLEATYPDKMTFYAYSAQRGTDQQAIFSIDNFLNVTPDIQLNADSITFQAQGMGQADAEKLVRDSGCWFRLVDIHESAIQPLIQSKDAPKTSYTAPGLNFVAGAEFAFEALSADQGPPKEDSKVLFTGKLTLGQNIFADYIMINDDVSLPKDPQDHVHTHTHTLETQVLGLPVANTSALVAEYPNDMTTLELRDRYQQASIRGFERQFSRTRAKEAAKVVEGYEKRGAKAPQWAVMMSKGVHHDG
ncbi:hypothetical protein A1O7_01574 [Cladophialophora yegresii CBS 114405]|uniref:PLP-dependent transferase n=1 Tax=Cladophialophora yegresii CBS 114405 TaxID=1182544 RepID=W9WBA0_9EURO|nr:uncharacterized protein A1O7_01574 [Cladophialophora yegresii CBS 114405]EXJ65233.1 hypothetical protein A1O7_01574 [Cladophialophora yegresii CBS 114405]